jgi:hypothetical protein
MYAFAGTNKGYSRALGAPNGRYHPNSLEALGLVERRGLRHLTYKITPAGRRVLEQRDLAHDLVTQTRRVTASVSPVADSLARGPSGVLSEREMEDAVAADPEKYLGEEGLELVARQHHIGGYIFDLLFRDRHGAMLIVELQRGTLDRNHTYKILDYYDEYKERHPDKFVDLMVVANKITRERQRRLTSHSTVRRGECGNLRGIERTRVRY